jgi:hypothetical protein
MNMSALVFILFQIFNTVLCVAAAGFFMVNGYLLEPTFFIPSGYCYNFVLKVANVPLILVKY